MGRAEQHRAKAMDTERFWVYCGEEEVTCGEWLWEEKEKKGI